MAIVIVLAFLAMTVAVGYALIRSQTTAILIEDNVDNLAQAREAAYTGALYGLRQMHQATWVGVGQTETVQLTGNVSVDINYIPGDSALASDDPTSPYRVTIVATGRVASDDAHAPDTTYQMEVVVQLVPRAMAAEPAEWGAMSSRTLTQWSGSNDVWIDIPAHIDGAAAVQGQLHLLEAYPAGTRGLAQYAFDLGQMAVNGRGDYRPFSGVVSLGPNAQRGDGYTLLTSVMGVPTAGINAGDTPEFRETAAPLTYQLFSGGPVYSVRPLPSELSNTALTPDPALNPLGVYTVTSHLTVGDNVSIDGVLIGALGNVVLSGTNIEMRGFELPSLADDDATYALPTLATRFDLIVGNGASATFEGFALVEGRFEVTNGTDATTWSMTGGMATSELRIGQRTNWPTSKSWWNDAVDTFRKMADRGEPIADYFPEYIRDLYGYDPAPRIVIKPQSSSIRYHWQDWSQPVFVPHADDPGLRWTVVRWQEES